VLLQPAAAAPVATAGNVKRGDEAELFIVGEEYAEVVAADVVNGH
jgi:hypothetical protein